MKFNSRLIIVFLTLFLVKQSFVAQSQNVSTESEINVQKYLIEEHLNVDVKEFFVNQIRKTDLVKPIDNHEFVHFFLNRFDNTYKLLIKLKFNQETKLPYSEIIDKVNDIIIVLANDFKAYKIANPNAPKNYNNGVNMRHFDMFDLGNRGAKKGANDKGPGQPCNNPDFETGDVTGWDLTEGNVNNTAYAYVGAVPATLAGAQHAIMVAGFDPIIPTLPTVNPAGGTFSLRLGDGTGTGSRAAGASQTFLVDANSEAFTYSYALVLEDPSGHTVGEKPFFKVNMYDQLGNSITCGDYQVIAGPVSSGGDPDFIAYAAGFYLPWRTTFAPLQGYVGQNVTIEFIVGDCSKSGHYGYGYIDASCQPLQIIPSQTVICGGNPVTLSAPAGAASYLWSPGGQTTQTITTNVPGNYSVDVIPVTGPACALTLTATIGGSPDYPIAVFNANPSTVCVGTSISFNNTSYVVGTSAIDSVKWDFNSDGIVDDISYNATYTYPLPGNYVATLVVYNNGCTDDTTMNIVVAAQPTAAFTFTNECFGSSTSFTDSSTANGATIAQWDWDFNNDGVVDNSSLVSNNPTNGYPSAGTYTAELLVTTALGCVDSVSMQIVVDPIPVASFTATNECVGTATTIVNTSTVATGSITGWGWDYGDMTGTSSLQNPPPYTYASAGNYTITLIATSDSGCTNTITVNVDVYNPPTAAFTTNDECLNVAATFTDNSNGNGGVINSWDWDLDGNGTTDDTNQNPTNLYTIDGTYNVQLIVSTATGCLDTLVQPVTIYPMPVASFTFINQCLGVGVPYTDNSTVTSGTIANWAWSFGNTNTSTLQNPTENFALEGVYTTQLIVTTNNGCEDTLTQQIEVWPNPVVNFNPTEVCLNALTQFTDVSTISNAYTTNTITLWNWNFNGQGSSIIQSPTFTFNTEGIIPTTLSITTNNGCTHDTTIDVTVNPLPQVSFGNPANGCTPVCVTFNNTSIISSGTMSYLWDFGDGSGSNIQNPSYCFNNSSYSVLKNFDITLIATSDKSCKDTLTELAMITVYPKPLANFSYSPNQTNIYDAEISFLDQSIIASNWSWNLGDGSTSTVSNPVHLYADSGSYPVVLYIENQYGCKDTTQRLVKIDPVFAIWIPNVFTPDGDNVNDYFFAKSYGIIELQTLVFDKWGILVYEGYSLDSMWDGTFKKNLSVQDVYVYKIKARDVFNKWHEFVGKITLLR